MLKIVGLLLISALVIVHSNGAKTVDSFLTKTDLERLQKVFSDGLKSHDIQSVYYSALNIDKITKEEKEATCKKLVETYSESKLNEFEKNFYLTAGHKHLGCSTPVPANILTSIKSAFSKDISTSQEIYYNIFSTKSIGVTLDDAQKTKIAKNLQTILKKDDSLSTLGHGFYIASELGASAAFVFDRIEDAIVQADEVDGKMLQFEGGLSITGLVISGALKLSSAQNKPSPITEAQAAKFTTYFLSRRSVQSTKGASILIEALTAISKVKTISPVCIQLLGNGQLKPESPLINVKISDVFGAPLILASVTATITSKTTNTALATKTVIQSLPADKSVYAIDFKSFKPTRGAYTIDIFADSFSQKLSVKLLGKVKVNSLEVGIGDSDSTSAVKKSPVVFPNKLSTVLNADSQQKLVLKANLLDEDTGKPITVHQAFILLIHKESGEEIIFVAEQDSTKNYKFDMDVGARSADFGRRSGLYSLELIVGDSSISNSFRWLIADVQIKFSTDSQEVEVKALKGPRPEIEHKFREPENRPPRFFSDLFAGLCAAPLVILFLIWGRLKVNISNFPFSLSAIGFHVGFGSILGLFGIFWLKLNMFETIKYLIPLAIFTFLCGNRLLRAIASRKSDK